VTDQRGPLSPAFYATRAPARRGRMADWWVLLHAPYTLWHLSYVAIGATIAPAFDGVRLTATLLAFFLAVGVGAHALDELQGRPMQTTIPTRSLVVVAAASILGAAGLGLAGVHRVGVGLVAFIVAGVALNCAYNLELFHGRLHNDVTFAAAWGAFPVLTAYYAQAETIGPAALAAAAFAFWQSGAQRALSTPARVMRRRVEAIDATVIHSDGSISSMTRRELLAPLETALKAMAWGMVALAVALIVQRTRNG